MSFDSLRDKQWQRLLQAIWSYSAISGPFDLRYSPGATTTTIPIAVPPPTATLTQHGRLKIGDAIIGCDVLATRSLFECVSILIPLGMFSATVNADGQSKAQSEVAELDTILSAFALAVYDVVPFRLAVVGYERECQVVTELLSDAGVRTKLIETGAFFAQDDVLKLLGVPTASLTQVRPNLYWMPAR